MSSAVFSVDAREVKKLTGILNNAQLNDSERKQLLRDLGAEMEDQTVERFSTKKDPDGNPWEDLAETTRKYYAKRFPQAQPTLVVSGELRDTVEGSSKVNSWKVVVGATKVYSAVHQFGWDEKNIPARPYLGIGPNDAEALADIATRFIARSLLRRAA